MKELEFMELLSELPPEYIEAAAGPQKKRRGIVFRKLYGIPVIAACLVAVIAAAVYPKLRTAVPEQIPEPEQTTYTTAAAGTSPYDETITAVTGTSLTDRDAAAEQTVTASQPAEQTAAAGTRDNRPAQTTGSVQNGAPAQQTNNDHAAAGTAFPSAKTTAPAKATTRPASGTTAHARTTAPERITTKTTVRTTAPPAMTTRATIRTTASPAMTTRATIRTTAPPAMTTRATIRTTVPPAVTTRATTRTTSPMMMVTTRAEVTMPDVTTAVAMTTCAAATTANDGSAGGGHWHGNPNAGPGSSSGAWHNTGGHGEYIGTETFEIPFMQVVVQASESGHYDGEILFRTESGDGFILPAEFADCPLPEWVDPADYTVLRMDYYGCFSDAAMTDAEYVNGSLTPSFCVLERGNTLRRFSVLFWFPNEVWVDADFCKEQISADWDAAHFYSTLPAFGDSFMISVDFYE